MIADIQPLHNTTTKFCNYADAITGVISIVHSLRSHSNEKTEKVKLWAIHNKLLINTSKSKEIVLCRQGNSRAVDQSAVVTEPSC
jgi:hypothetical protein